ncbi:hypothetical protein K439DRAFT_1665703 [Ramaria rubella]|nr:hypothetical protein K439DRAFT_1665703 [Ramaria rubella]
MVPPSILPGRSCHSPEMSPKQIEAFLDGRKGDLTEDEKARFTEISLKIKQLDGVENACKLPLDMQDFLKVKAQAWRDHKHTAPRASTRAVIQDARLALESISSELMALTARTGMETMLFAVKGHAEHSMPEYISVSAKADHYLIHGLKKYTSDIAKEFETYILTDVDGLTLNHNGRLAELKRKIRTEIRQGLVEITNDAKAMMQFDRYEKLIVVDRRVQLVNWPEGIPFVNASEIGSFHDLERLLRALTHDDYEDRCCWVTLSQEEWQQCQEAYFDAHLSAEPKRTKRKGCAAAESESDGGSSDSKNREVQAGPSKRARKAKASSKENDGVVASAGKKKGTGGAPKSAKKSMEKGSGKGKAKKNKESPLAPVNGNEEVAPAVWLE